MDHDHLHMEIVNDRQASAEAYSRCLAVLDEMLALPGQGNYTGEQESYNVAMRLGEAIKDMISHNAAAIYRMNDGDDTVAARFFFTSLGHISTEQLGARFYTSTVERYES